MLFILNSVKLVNIIKVISIILMDDNKMVTITSP